MLELYLSRTILLNPFIHYVYVHLVQMSIYEATDTPCR